MYRVKMARNNNVREENWTNERHSNFLSLMEASFVRSMFDKNKVEDIDNININVNNVDYDRRHHHHHHHHRHRCGVDNARLDRFVPDISESTLDLPTRKFTTTQAVVRVLDPVMRTQRQRPLARPYKTSNDQVVPWQRESAAEKDEK